MDRNMYLIKVANIANSSDSDRSEILMKEMCQLMTSMIDYNYTAEHYKGDGTAVEDKKNVVRNNLALVMSELDIYAAKLKVTGDVEKKAESRINRLHKKI